MQPMGKRRSAGINILLFIVTIGVYWFVWLWKAFGELEARQGKTLNRQKFLIPMIVLWVAQWGLSGARIFDAVSSSQNQTTKSPAQAFQDALAQSFGPEFFIATAITTVFYIVQLVFVLGAVRLLRETVAGIPGLTPPGDTMTIAFNILFILGAIPIVGGIASLAGVVVAIVWVVSTQNALNAVWAGTPPAGGPPPVPSFEPKGAPRRAR